MAIIRTLDGVVGNTGVTLTDLPYSRANILARITTSEAGGMSLVPASATLDPGLTHDTVSSFLDYPSGSPAYALRALPSGLIKSVNGLDIFEGVPGLDVVTAGYEIPNSLIEARDAITIVAICKPKRATQNQGLLSCMVSDGTSAMLDVAMSNTDSLRLVARRSTTAQDAAIATLPGLAPEAWVGLIGMVDYQAGSIRLIALTPTEATAEHDILTSATWGGGQSAIPATGGVTLLGRASATANNATWYWRGGFQQLEIHEGIPSGVQVQLIKRALSARLARLN